MLYLTSNYFYASFFCIFLLLCAGCIDTNAGIDTNFDINASSNTSSGQVTDTSSVEMRNAQYKSLINASSADDYDIATANNAFAFDMYANIKKEDENVFFSPYSIFSAMGICYGGAEGSTKEQISNVLYYPLNKHVLEITSKELIDTINSDKGEYELNTANALWISVDFPLNQQFAYNSKLYYGGNVTNLDFDNEPEKSKDIINEWVEEKTKNRIKDLITDDLITDYTEMIITNAVYFKGNWSHEFKHTSEESFYPSGGEETSVDTMYIKQSFNYAENEDERILEIPYKGNNLSMYIILPRENNIEDFEKQFSVSDYNNLKSSMEPKSEVNLWLPKFRFETKTKLSQPLRNMGIVDAFEESANFSSMYDVQKASLDYSLYVKEAVHEACVDVQEEGTEATAATAVAVYTTEGAGEQLAEIINFKVDHPFMFFIEDKRTSCILFMGKVEKPAY